MADGAIGRHAIGPRQHRRGEVGHGGGVRAHIGAVVVKEFVVDAENAALRVDGGADAVDLLARMIGGDQMLAPVLDPLDRRLEDERGGADQHVLGIDFAADAEAAADMALIKLHGVARPSQHLRQRVAVPMRHLGGAMHFQNVARLVVAGDGAARLQRHAGMAADGKLERDDGVGGAEGGVDIAIALADDAGLGGQRPVEDARRRARIHRYRQRFDVERHAARRRPRRHRHRRRRPRRPARRHSARCRCASTG